MNLNILLFSETDDGLWLNPVKLTLDDLPNGIPQRGDTIICPPLPQHRNLPADHQVMLEVLSQIIDPHRPYVLGLIVSERSPSDDELDVIEAFRAVR